MELVELPKNQLFNRESYQWSDETIILDNDVDKLEQETGLQIALAINYYENGDLKYIKVVTKDRRHYKLIR